MADSLHWSSARTISSASHEALELRTIARVEALAARDDIDAKTLAQSPHALRARVSADPQPFRDGRACDPLRDPRQELPVLCGQRCAHVVNDTQYGSRRRWRTRVRTCAHASR